MDKIKQKQNKYFLHSSNAINEPDVGGHQWPVSLIIFYLQLKFNGNFALL